MKFDTDVEYVLIGEIIAKPEIMAECVLYLTADSFSSPDAGRVYSECVKLYSAGKAIDPLSIVAAMGQEKDEYKEFILSCYKSVVSVSAYQQHIELVRENAIKRDVGAACFDLVSDIELFSLDDMQSRLSEILKKFDRKTGSDTRTVPELHAELLSYLQSQETYITTELAKLDRNLLISKGDYIIVGGRPSSGKTALTAQFALNMSRRYNVVYFSFETSPLKLWMRMNANGAVVKLYDIKTKAVMSNCYPDSTNVWRRINDFAVGMTENANFTVVSAAGYTVEQIRAKALQLKADVIFIDYLTLIPDGGKSAYERATKISTDLHTLAQRENIAVIAVAQLNRQSLTSDKPSMADLRESGQIEQDADAILLLSNKRDTDIGEYAERTLYLAKNKDGETGEIDLIFRGDWQKFEEKEVD